MKMKLLIAALIASLICCAALTYLWVDRSITLNYVEQSANESTLSLQQLEGLLGSEWSGMTEKEVLDKLRADAARHPARKTLIQEQDGAIWFDQIRFNFEQGRLKSIENN